MFMLLVSGYVTSGDHLWAEKIFQLVQKAEYAVAAIMVP